MNRDTRGELLLPELSDGRSDIFTPPSATSGFDSAELSFRELTFSADNLPKFNCYRIKIVLASMNQVFCPRINNLRVLTLA